MSQTQLVADHRDSLATVPDIWMQLLSHEPQGYTGQKTAGTHHWNLEYKGCSKAQGKKTSLDFINEKPEQEKISEEGNQHHHTINHNKLSEEWNLFDTDGVRGDCDC